MITANPASRAYGAADPTFTDTISGFINGQTLATSGVTGAPSFTTTASSTSHVGNTYEVVAGIGSLQSADYLFSFMPGTLTITPAPLTIMANNTSQPFGTTPSLSASYIGLVNGDTAASLTTPAVLSTTATGTSLPGTYPITVSGASSADYSITYKSGTFTVQQSSTFSSLEGPILRSSVTSPVTFTVDVSSSSEGSIPLTGVVAFYDQAQMIGAVPVVNGIATLSTSALAEGDYMVYAVYQGDTNYEPSSTGTIDSDGHEYCTGRSGQTCDSDSRSSQEGGPQAQAQAQGSGAEAQGTSGRQAQSAFSYQAAGGRSRQDACQTGSGPDETVGMMCPSSWPQSAIDTWLSPSFLLSRCCLLFPKCHSKCFR